MDLWGPQIYDTSIIQHTIPINPSEKAFKHKFSRDNPELIPIIDKEITKLFNAIIIMRLRFSKWVMNVVPVRKNNGEIWICKEFRNINKVSLKYSYLFPKMEHIL